MVEVRARAKEPLFAHLSLEGVGGEVRMGLAAGLPFNAGEADPLVHWRPRFLLTGHLGWGRELSAPLFDRTCFLRLNGIGLTRMA
ncbi:hypothetical protein GCM10027180_12990 [Microbulbifer echini]